MRSLQVAEIEIPKTSESQLLIKVTGAPCNPSDIAFMLGGYNIRKPLPAVMGFECTGTVVETGAGPELSSWIGKRVSCFTQDEESGTWAEYIVTRPDNCLVLRDDLDDEQAAALCINPFTAYALFSMAMKKGARAIIQNGASGQVGIFIRALAKRQGIPVINLVRKEEHENELTVQGEKHVLNLNDPDLETKLRALAQDLHAGIAFDAVAGDGSGLMLNSMPPGSELIIYGGLSGKPAGTLNPLDIIFKSKSVRGFNLGDWKQEVGEKYYSDASAELQQLIADRVLFTRIRGTYPLGEIQVAMEKYIRNMSAGKILLRP
jgi:NADPH:quinone reductase-like Zn-dependent oxidoreductase